MLRKLTVFRSSVGPEYARCRGIVFIVIALVILIALIALIVTTVSYTARYPGIYVAYVGKYLVTQILLIERIQYFE